MIIRRCHINAKCCFNTAILRKVVGKSARDNSERYCGWLWGHFSSKKFERMVREATDICLRVLKGSNNSRFNNYSQYEQFIDHIPYYLSELSRAHFFRQPFSKKLYTFHCQRKIVYCLSRSNFIYMYARVYCIYVHIKTSWNLSFTLIDLLSALTCSFSSRPVDWPWRRITQWISHRY